MNEFKESLKVSKVHKEKWDNARKRLEGEERWI